MAKGLKGKSFDSTKDRHGPKSVPLPHGMEAVHGGSTKGKITPNSGRKQPGPPPVTLPKPKMASARTRRGYP